jgi:hypothetical protein
VTSAHWRHLAQHDVLRDTPAIIQLSARGGLEKNLDSLLEGASHECTGVRAIDAVSGDGRDGASVAHDIHKQGDVTVVDV